MDYFNPASIAFGLDLVSAALNQLKFLKQVNSVANLRNENVLRNAIRRYEKLWMPLVAGHENEYLAAPLDIEWIWHCHMLCPRAYEQDCSHYFGKIIHHKLMIGTEREKCLNRSKEIWACMYDGEAFEIGVNSVQNSSDKSFQSGFSYDLLAAAKRQELFYYQVSLPHYKDKGFLEKAVLRYKKMLHLKKTNPGVFFVPCYDMDLIWHSHQLFPGIYKLDTEIILGRLFNHDDSTNDRSTGSRLQRADLQTREIWRATFKENFSLYGAMFRGDPPCGKLYKLSNNDILAISAHNSHFKIKHIDATALATHVDSRNTPFELRIYPMGRFMKDKMFCSFTGQNPVWSSDKSLPYDTATTKGIRFELIERTRGRFPCLCRNVENMRGKYELKTVGEKFIDVKKTKTSIDLSETVKIKGEITAPQRSKCLFYLDKGVFETKNVPANIEEFWGPVQIPPLPLGASNTCNIATHRLVVVLLIFIDFWGLGWLPSG